MSYTVQPFLKECFENGTDDSEIIEKVLHAVPKEVATVTKITKIIALAISSIATIITVIYIIAVIKAVRNRTVSRKCYVLILNRSFGDFLTSFSFVFLSILRLAFVDFTNTQMVILQILQYIINAALWSEMISYNLLSGIKLYAVAKPLHYRNKFTMKRCIYLASLSWVVFMTIFCIHLAMYIICGKANCGTFAGKIEDSTSTGIYCFTVLFFILTAMYVFHANKFQDERSKKSKFPFSRFAIMFGVFIFFYSFITAADIYFSFIYPGLSFCFKTLKQAAVSGAQESVWILLILRICIDPIINCLIDQKIKASVKSLFGINPSVAAPLNNRKNLNNHNSGHSGQTTIASNETSVPSSPVKK